jgi:hypothetical protein
MEIDPTVSPNDLHGRCQSCGYGSDAPVSPTPRWNEVLFELHEHLQVNICCRWQDYSRNILVQNHGKACQEARSLQILYQIDNGSWRDCIPVEG